MDSDISQQHHLLAAKLKARISRARKMGKHIDPKVANELEFHQNSVAEDVQDLSESYNFFLYYAQKADEDGKGAEATERSHAERQG